MPVDVAPFDNALISLEDRLEDVEHFVDDMSNFLTMFDPALQPEAVSDIAIAALAFDERVRVRNRIQRYIERQTFNQQTKKARPSLIIRETLANILYEMRYESVVADALLTPNLTTTEEGNYLSMRNGMLTYMPSNRTQHIKSDRSWATEGRMLGKPARIARKFLLPSAVSDMTDKDFELFSNKLRAQDVSAYGCLKMVSGDELVHWYDGDLYAANQGSLNNSCLRYKECADWLTMYRDHPQIVQMLCLFDNAHGRLLARALVWTTDKGTFMDRVYGSDVSIELFREHAAKKGWIRRFYNSYTYPTDMLLPDGTAKRMRMTVDLDNHDYEHYPYMDTLKYLSDDGTLTNDSRRKNNKYVLNTGDGFLHVI